MDRTEARLAVARSESPRILLIGAGLVALASVLTWIEEPEAPVVIHVFDFAAALVMAGCAWLVLRQSVPPRAVPWLMATGLTAVGLSLIAQMWIMPKEVGFSYLMVVLIALGPTVLDWRAWGTAAAVLFVAIWVLVAMWPLGHASEWLIVSGAGVITSALLLGIRLRSIDALAEARQSMADLATTDALTGLLNRHGLAEQTDRLVALARRLESPVFVLFIDIEGLKAANDRYGHAFGDEVIVTAARAVVATTRADDLVTRWGGDEIVVIGLGGSPNPDDLGTRLTAVLDASGLDRQRWSGELSIGASQSWPAQLDLAALIDGADADMYRRREERRGQRPSSR